MAKEIIIIECDKTNLIQVSNKLEGFLDQMVIDYNLDYEFFNKWNQELTKPSEDKI